MEPGDELTRPHPNSYVVPGARLIAGEYPFTADPATAGAKLCRCLDSGVSTFIDLTETDELDPYEETLRDESRARGSDVDYVRLPIPDMGVPTRERMRRILDEIDAALEAGRTVYVHCWGGIGRTGTVVGCYLVRRGVSGEEALKRVGELYRQVSAGKRRRNPESPQTEGQRAFVRGWEREERT